MQGYLGTVVIDTTTHPEFKDMTPTDYALLYILMYGGIDGSHHKDWVLDQVARILSGVEVIVSEASWDNGQTEYRYSTADEVTNEYNDFVGKCRGDWDRDNEEWEYNYEFGIAP